MGVFVAIGLAGFIVLVGGSLFGHDHDFAHDHDFGHDHDVGYGTEPTVSIFSAKVIGTFIMAFGAVGAIARWHECGPLGSSLWGLAVGIFLGLTMYGVLRTMYSQQSTSLISSQALVQQTGTVTVSIDAGSIGQVDISVGSQRLTYLARATSGSAIPKGRTVRVVETHGDQLVVEEVS